MCQLKIVQVQNTVKNERASKFFGLFFLFVFSWKNVVLHKHQYFSSNSAFVFDMWWIRQILNSKQLHKNWTPHNFFFKQTGKNESRIFLESIRKVLNQSVIVFLFHYLKESDLSRSNILNLEICLQNCKISYSFLWKHRT